MLQANMESKKLGIRPCVKMLIYFHNLLSCMQAEIRLSQITIRQRFIPILLLESKLFNVLQAYTENKLSTWPQVKMLIFYSEIFHLPREADGMVITKHYKIRISGTKI